MRAVALFATLLAGIALAQDSAVESAYRHFVTLLASGQYQEAENSLSPDGLSHGDITIEKAVAVRRLSDPKSELRQHLEQSFTEDKKGMCREVGLAYLAPRAFLDLTRGRYEVHIQQEDVSRNFFLVSAHSSVTVEGTECTITLFPHAFEKTNGKIYLVDYFRF